jgi:hypothetical protein
MSHPRRKTQASSLHVPAARIRRDGHLAGGMPQGALGNSFPAITVVDQNNDSAAARDDSGKDDPAAM